MKKALLASNHLEGNCLLDNITYLFKFIDDLPVGIISADSTNKTPNQANKYFLDMIGWSLEEIDTVDKWFLKVYPDDDDRAEALNLWEEMSNDAESKNLPYSYPVETKVTCKDGSFKWCEVRYYRKELLIYGIFTDISERKIAEQKLQDLSLFDPLTKVHNRRYFNIKFYELWQLSKRSQIPISLIICDIDDFKKVNDTYGHLEGDKVLMTIAHSISATLKRTTDFVARYGGEEFVIVSYDSDSTASVDLCEMIQHNISNICVNDDYTTCVTLSYGINTVIANADMTPEEFLNNADKALYEAKNTGKNKFVVFRGISD